MKTTLILDFNNVLYRGIAVHPHSSHEGIYTGGLFGFIIQLVSLLNKYEPSTVIACTDSKPYLRTELYPDYKKRRGNNPLKPEVEAHKQIARIQCERLLNELGIPIWAVDGFEADDLMYYACERASGKVVIVSNDDDLNQLFYSFGNIAMDRSGKLYTEEIFFAEYPSWTKRDYITWLAIKGTHNGVPGVAGYGPKKARDIIEKGDPGVLIKEHPEVQLFKRLIKLPFDEIPAAEEKKLHFREPRFVQAAMRMLYKHGIKITPNINNSLKKWETA